jgi:hypothetical protein
MLGITYITSSLPAGVALIPGITVSLGGTLLLAVMTGNEASLQEKVINPGERIL